MAKALFGHLGPNPERLLAEVRRLQGRVGELERELTHARALNESLLAAVRVEDDLSGLTSQPEPALT